MKNDLKKIATDILSSECLYKYTNRSAWVCGFGKGKVAFIEDHKNELSIKAFHFAHDIALCRDGFIDYLIEVTEMSNSNIEYRISVEICDLGNPDCKPDDDLLSIAKTKLKFGYPVYSDITESGIEDAVSAYFSSQKTEQEEIFG